MVRRRTRIVKSAGRYRAGFGKTVRERITEIESKQRQKQKCIFCGKTVKRKAKGIWYCKNCNKKFAQGTYYIE